MCISTRPFAPDVEDSCEQEKRGRFKSKRHAQVRLSSTLRDITASTGVPREARCEQSIAGLTIGSEGTKTEVSTAGERCSALERKETHEDFMRACI
jgi:hypothetical protein